LSQEVASDNSLKVLTCDISFIQWQISRCI